MRTMRPHREGGLIDITRYAEVMAHIRHFPADKYLELTDLERKPLVFYPEDP